MLTTFDWSLILFYLLFALAAGVWTSKAASQSLASYFVASRGISGRFSACLPSRQDVHLVHNRGAGAGGLFGGIKRERGKGRFQD